MLVHQYQQFHVEQNLGPEILVGNSSFFRTLDRNAYIQNQHVILVQKTRRESMKYFGILWKSCTFSRGE